MTYPEIIRKLSALATPGKKFGLELTQTLAARLGNPEASLDFIHIAGTNGKGSTAAMIEGIYRAAGYRTGLYTSPHLVRFTERVQVNRGLMPETDVVRLFAEITSVMDSEQAPSFFEVVTLLALLWFKEQRCDVVIWETGLGGRLDATNIVTPRVSVITNVELDHEQWLGHTTIEIAGEKAGIIKRGVPVLTATRDPGALGEIEKTARREQAPLQVITEPLISRRIGLPGKHQQMNAALAVAVVEELQQRFPVPDQAITEGLAATDWPGRFQRFRRSQGQTLILDGAHNPAGFAALRDAIVEEYPEAAPVVIMGILRDKNFREMCSIMGGIARRVHLVPVKNERSLEINELRAAGQRARPEVEWISQASLPDALGVVQDPLVVVTGSLYLVGEAIELLSGGNPAENNERSLNDWGAAGASTGGLAAPVASR